MKLTDLDRVIEHLERPPLFRDYTGTDYDTCAYCREPVEAEHHHHSEICPWLRALALLRTMRDNASQTTYLRCPKCGQTGWSSVICACDPATAQTERVLAILITPEDV